MVTVLAGLVGLLLTALLFRGALQRKSGKLRWFIWTPWEPYVGAGLVLAFGASVVVIMSGLAELLG
jgi:hypothetical protein